MTFLSNFIIINKIIKTRLSRKRIRSNDYSLCERKFLPKEETKVSLYDRSLCIEMVYLKTGCFGGILDI